MNIHQLLPGCKTDRRNPSLGFNHCVVFVSLHDQSVMWFQELFDALNVLLCLQKAIQSCENPVKVKAVFHQFLGVNLAIFKDRHLDQPWSLYFNACTHTNFQRSRYSFHCFSLVVLDQVSIHSQIWYAVDLFDSQTL